MTPCNKTIPSMEVKTSLQPSSKSVKSLVSSEEMAVIVTSELLFYITRNKNILQYTLFYKNKNTSLEIGQKLRTNYEQAELL